MKWSVRVASRKRSGMKQSQGLGVAIASLRDATANASFAMTICNTVRLGFFDENSKSQRRDKSPSLQ